jgi:hypothetical protein
MVVGDWILQLSPDEQDDSGWPRISDIFQGDENWPGFHPNMVSADRFVKLWLSNRESTHQEWTPREQSPLDNLLADYIHYVSAEGWTNRCRTTFKVLGRNCDQNTGLRRTFQCEKEINSSWLRNQSQLNQLPNRDIQVLDHFINHLQNIQSSDADNYQDQEQQRLSDQQREGEAQQS